MSIPVVCPYCATKLRAPDDKAGRKMKCPKCGSAVVVPIEEVPLLEVEPTAEGGQKPRRSGSLILSLVGAVLFLGGVFFSIIYYNMDTTVRTEVGRRRVHNIGLLEQRRIGLMVSLASVAGGFVLVYIGQRK